jgi:UDP-N-acetylglucosamine:LPS N-acetylglucosamine transferase
MATKKILAIASGGGHWIQLYRMRPAFDGHHVTYASTMPGLAASIADDAKVRGQLQPDYIILPEANRWQKLKMLKLLLRVGMLLLKLRPDYIISTGAAHGFFAIRMGAFLGAKTIWIDSIANAEDMSMSGRLIKTHVSHCLSQWEDVATKESVEFHGAVL